MKISLITVSYNSEETIRDTFESVRSQETEGFELEYIHVDGLSSDTTMRISEEFTDIVSVSVSEKDTGIYNAMNKGISLATGDVIGFLNSDDTYSSNDILHNVSKLLLKDEEIEVVYGDINYVDSRGRIKRKWRTGQQQSFRRGWHPAHPGFMQKKNFLRSMGALMKT